MAKLPDAYIGKRLFVGEGKPECLGRGPLEIRGSGYLEGPVVMGNATAFPNVWATTMIAPVTNTDLLGPPLIPGTLCTGIHNPYSLAVQGSSAFMGPVDTNNRINVGTHVIAQGHVISNCGAHILAAKKNFDIPHPPIVTGKQGP